MIGTGRWAGWRYWDRTSDLLGVNEWQEGQRRSLVQLTDLLRSHAVGEVWRGCCTYLLLRHEAQCYIACAAGRDERSYLWI
jgi:hypothetical protein